MFRPPLAGSTTSAPSVGSPIISPAAVTTASQARAMGSRNGSNATSPSPNTWVIVPSVPYPVPETPYRRPGIVSCTAVIWLSVSVPVLSEQIADVAPSVSVERNRLTIALAPARSWVPRERMVVTTGGRPVGIAAIANATATVNTSVKLCPRAMFSTIETTSASAAIVTSCLVNRSNCTVNGDLDSSWPANMPEMWPTSVPIPVAVTTNSPVPRVTLVFMYTMSVRSPSGASGALTASTPLPTGTLSPVSAASATSNDAAATTRPSAGTTSPASTATTSPGTSSSAASSINAPSRRTRALMIIILASAATAAAALPSWPSPNTALRTVSR